MIVVKKKRDESRLKKIIFVIQKKNKIKIGIFFRPQVECSALRWDYLAKQKQKKNTQNEQPFRTAYMTMLDQHDS